MESILGQLTGKAYNETTRLTVLNGTDNFEDIVEMKKLIDTLNGAGDLAYYLYSEIPDTLSRYKFFFQIQGLKHLADLFTILSQIFVNY